MNRFLVLWILFLLSVAAYPHQKLLLQTAKPAHAISYQGGERFGDRMMIYGQARYLSYLTSLPLLWRPFLYSHQIGIENQAESYEQNSHRYAQIFHIGSSTALQEFFRKIADPNTPPTLFILDYLPLDMSEWDLQHQNWSLCFDIPWHDETFNAYFRNTCLPKIPIPDLRKPGRLNIADHVRTYSGGDNHTGFPLKQTNLAYHIRQIRRVYDYALKTPLYVFLFTDTKKPLELLEIFRQAFAGEDILFDTQIHENVDTDYVVQDFFAMQKFDVLISTQSSFSMMASCLGSFDMIIYPVHSSGQHPDSELACPWQIDRVKMISKKSAWFPYALNITLKE